MMPAMFNRLSFCFLLFSFKPNVGSLKNLLKSQEKQDELGLQASMRYIESIIEIKFESPKVTE